MKIVVERGLLPGHKTSTWAHVRQVARGKKEKGWKRRCRCNKRKWREEEFFR